MSDSISILYKPTPPQKQMWWWLVMEDDGVDPEGYWLGWCPLHDNDRLPDVATAQFNFRKGVMRCLAEEPCHDGKRVMSLTNVAMVLATRGVADGQR